MFNRILSFFCLALTLSGSAAGRCLPPIDPENPIINADFEDGTMYPYRFSSSSRTNGNIIQPGYRSEYMFRSFNMIDNNLLEIQQDIRTIGGTYYHCSYNWRFDEYYVYNNRVPYLRIWLNNEIIGNRYPTGPAQAGVWMEGDVYFTTSLNGLDTFYLNAASPQPSEVGENAFELDNLECEALVVGSGHKTRQAGIDVQSPIIMSMARDP